MASFFLAVGLLLGGEPTPKPAEDTANAARALLETARWVEVKDNHGDMEIRALAAEDERKAEQAMRDYHDRYQEAMNSYRGHEKKYADAISQLTRRFIDGPQPVTVDRISQYFRDRRELKEQLVAKSPRRVVPKPPYRRVLRHGEWWELRFDEKLDDSSTYMYRSDTHSTYLHISTVSCGFCTSPPGLLDHFPGVLDGTENRDIRIDVKEQVIIVKRRQLRFEFYRLSQIDAAEAVPSLKEAVPSAKIHYDRESNTILVLGFPDEHKAIEQAIAQLRASGKKPTRENDRQ